MYGGGTLNVTSLQVDNGRLWVNLAGQGTGTATINFTTAAVAAVPEPATLSLLGGGLLAVATRRNRRRQATRR